MVIVRRYILTYGKVVVPLLIDSHIAHREVVQGCSQPECTRIWDDDRNGVVRIRPRPEIATKALRRPKSRSMRISDPCCGCRTPRHCGTPEEAGSLGDELRFRRSVSKLTSGGGSDSLALKFD